MKARLLAAVMAGVFACAGGAAQAAKLYKWVDENGNVSYHDQPPSSGNYRVEEKDIEGGEQAKANGAESAAEKYPVVLYTASGCGGCDQARAYLQRRKVPFNEINLENNPAAQQAALKKIGSLSVPTITVGDKVMKGYMESLLEGELDAAGYPKVPAPEAGSATPADTSSQTENEK